jgi:hypothetical protein
MQKTFKLITLVVLFLSSNTVFGQEVKIEGSNEVEVGIPTDFTLKFKKTEKLPVFIRKSVKKGSYIVRISTKNFYDYQTLIIE